jgi:hypothetical protein
MADLSVVLEMAGELDRILEAADMLEMAAHMDHPKAFLWIMGARAKFSPSQPGYDPDWSEWHDSVDFVAQQLLTKLPPAELWELLPILGMTTEKLIRRHLTVLAVMDGDAAAAQVLATFGHLDATLKEALSGRMVGDMTSATLAKEAASAPVYQPGTRYAGGRH